MFCDFFVAVCIRSEEGFAKYFSVKESLCLVFLKSTHGNTPMMANETVWILNSVSCLNKRLL